MWRTTLSVLAVLTLVAVVQLDTGTAVAAPTWLVGLHTASSGLSHAQSAPAAPASVTATCNSVLVLGNSVKLSWPAVTHASSYTIHQSTTAATGPYTVAATATTTAWTSPALAAGSYWFEISATIGSNWAGPSSTASSKRTITAGLLCT